MKNSGAPLALLAVALIHSAPASDRVIQPILDVPLRHAAITKGPDATYYLTGTAATLRSDGTEDFDNNDGIWVWSSTDLKEWLPLGQVWSISALAGRPGPELEFTPSKWQTMWRTRPGEADSPPVRGMTTPEIHYLRGTFLITYSMNGHGTGLLKSTSGRAEGPYEDIGRITMTGGSPSMFEDDDGSVHWVWGEGWIAKMNDDLTALAEEPRLLKPAPEVVPGFPLRAGSSGAFLFKADVPGYTGPYHLVVSDFIPRMGATPCHDTFIISSEKLEGPYNTLSVMVPHGGEVTVFEGPEGQWFSTFSGNDDWAAFRDRAGIVPLIKHPTVFGEDWWWAGAFTKPFYPVTERGEWGKIEPFLDTFMRDVCVLNAPDGWYYLTGSRKFGHIPLTESEKVGVEAWKSRDLKTWEPMGILWRADDDEPSREGLRRLAELRAREGKETFGNFILYDMQMQLYDGTYWLIGSMQTAAKWFEENGTLLLVLKSRSGQPEGPYEWAWNDRHDSAFWTPDLFVDDDGTPYLLGGGVGNNVVKLKRDLSGFDGEPFKIRPEGSWHLGEGGHLLKIGDTYVHTCAVWHGMDPYQTDFIKRGRFFSTYDLVYTTAKDLRGPWTPTRIAAPKCGNAKPFQDKIGNWWAPFFGNHFFGPWLEMPGAYPIRVTQNADGVSIEPEKAMPMGTTVGTD